MNQTSTNTNRWELIGLIAALIIVISIPVYYFSTIKNAQLPDITRAEASFVGSVECQDCHKLEYDKWQGSHHDLAMDVANENTVLGDFNNTEFTIHGVTSRFYT